MSTAQRAALGALLLTLIAAGCSPAPTIVSTHDLDRPTDMVFGCVGLFAGDGTDGAASSRPSGRPMTACQGVGASAINRTFAFVPNSARGELSVIDMEASKLVDLDLAVSGFTTAPLGELPEALAISDDGCRVVTANRGSCDLTLVDPGLLMAPTLSRVTPDAGVPEQPTTTPTQTIVVRTGSGKPLRAAPYEVQFLPQIIESLVLFDDNLKEAVPSADQLCTSDHPVVPPRGWDPTPAALSGWKALVTYPTCDLVALVDLPSGIIIDSVKVKSDTTRVELVPQGSEPTCPVECGVGVRPVPVSDTDAGDATAFAHAADDGGDDDAATTVDADDDAGAMDDGGAASPEVAEAGAETGAGPEVAPPLAPLPDTISRRGTASIAIQPLGARAYVGLTSVPLVAAIDIVPETGRLQTPDVGAAIPLSGALGVRRVRLSVDPFTSSKNLPFIHGADNQQTRKYLYVIARDGTVRVVDLDSQKECDNNVDHHLLTPADRMSSCLTVDDVNKRQLHNPLITGPGIRLPSNPRDITFAQIIQPQVAVPLENQLDGAYGFILTDSGAVYLTNVYPVPRQVIGVTDGMVGSAIKEQLPLANSLRDRNFISYTTILDGASGPPRLDLPPVAPVYGAKVEGFLAVDTADNYVATTGVALKTYVYFPDREVVTPQTWTVTWEGSLIGLRFSGLIKGPILSKQTGTYTDSYLYDVGGGFCDSGVVAGDILTMLGCSDDAQCGAGLVCRRSTTVPQTSAGLGINGICVSPDATTQNTQLTMTCRRLLESVRRYDVIVPHPDRLLVRPHIDEVVKTNLDPNRCLKATVDDPNAVSCGVPSSTDPSYSRFRCQDIGAGMAMDFRCVNRCGQPKPGTTELPSIEQGDTDCRLGRKCVDFGGKAGRLCADAPSADKEGELINSECFPQLTTYSVQAGRGFLVQGSATAIPVAAATFNPAMPGPGVPPSFPDEPLDGESPFADPLNPLVCVPPVPPAPDPAIPSTAFSSALAFRIPMNAPECQHFPAGLQDPQARAMLNTTGNPVDIEKKSTADNLPLSLLRQPPSVDPNPCLFIAGPNDGDPQGTSVAVADAGAAAPDGGTADGGAPTSSAAITHVRARFRNPELQFILSNLEQQFANVSQIRFDVHGGFVPQAVLAPATIEVGLPARLMSSPLASVFGAPGTAPTPSSPYLFVVDQRRVGRNRLAGGATRGQILRINLQHYNSSDPNNPALIYDDLTSSTGLFPIQ